VVDVVRRATVRVNVPELPECAVSEDVYAPVIRSEPDADGVKLEEQLEVVALIATRVHGFGLLNVPAAGVLKRTAPAGALVVPTTEVSLTNAVHEDAWLTTTEAGVQTTVVEVVLRATAKVKVPELLE
jgi:hypothetical protein